MAEKKLKLDLYTVRMLQFYEFVKVEEGLSPQEFWSSIGFNYKNESNLRTGKTAITSKHILQAINRYKKYNLDANFFFRKDAGMILIDKKDISVKVLLQEALRKL